MLRFITLLWLMCWFPKPVAVARLGVWGMGKGVRHVEWGGDGMVTMENIASENTEGEWMLDKQNNRCLPNKKKRRKFYNCWKTEFQSLMLKVTWTIPTIQPPPQIYTHTYMLTPTPLPLPACQVPPEVENYGQTSCHCPWLLYDIINGENIK